jgi:hypothetical protein
MGKKTAIIAVLVVVILCGLIWVLKGAGLLGDKPTLPNRVVQEPTEKIDQETLEVVTLPFGEWEKLGQKDGKYKNPKTGKYSMVADMVCAHCGAKIPAPDLSSIVSITDPKELMATRAKLLAEYKCPKCGKSPR